MIKRIMAIICAGVMSISIAACTDQKDAKEEQMQPQSVNTQSAEENKETKPDKETKTDAKTDVDEQTSSQNETETEADAGTEKTNE